MQTLSKCLFLFLLAGWHVRAAAQDSVAQQPAWKVSAYMETYFSYDFNRPANHLKPSFQYNHNRHQEININLALVHLSYADAGSRGTVSLMGGTYPQYNLAGEPELLRMVYEAYAGVKLSRKRALWLDAGVLPSHLGFESAIGKQNWALTRSLVAESSPYYEAGVRFSYQTGDKRWYAAVLLLNGWQRIRRLEGNSTPSFGTQVTYVPSSKWTWNSSSFIGNDKPDSARQWRYFHNFYAVWQVRERLGLTFGLDAGVEQKEKGSRRYHPWFAPVVLLRYHRDHWAVTGRAEYFADKQGVIVPQVSSNPFRMQGYSVNGDRTLRRNLLWRLEARWFRNAAPYFLKGSELRTQDVQLTTSLILGF